ncbi:hypothetical protein BYT27DRAFT_7240679 [Phlegmacium glaucopus]|nr:hypothetical protein BYT27DRAFT_7240679 [Phlegmacium glaucopus]
MASTAMPITSTNVIDLDEELTEVEEELHENPRTMAGLLSLVLSDIHNDISNPQYMRVIAPSPEVASEALFYHLRHLVIGSPVPDYLHPDATVINVIEAAMSTSYICVTIRFEANERAVGSGPISDGFFTPVILPVQAVSEADKKEFIFCGFLIRQCLIWGLDPLPISPFLLAFLFKDLDHALAPDFIRAVAPKAAIRLATWPPQPTVNDDGSLPELDLHPGKDPLDLIIQTIPHLQAAHIRSMSNENHEQLLPAIKAELLFTHQTMDIQNSLLQPHHPIFKSLMKGLDYPFPPDAGEEVTENPVRLSEIFQLNLDPIPLLTTIYKDRTITNPSQLFRYFDWTSIESIPEDPNVGLYSAREQRFRHLLCSYLEGVGHPPRALSVTQAAEREARDDTLLRSRLFLETVTASVTLPWAHECISFQIIFKSHLSTPTAHASGAHFHTCFKQVEFQIDDTFSNLVDMGNAEITVEATAAFNVWMRSLLWNGTQVFNDV